MCLSGRKIGNNYFPRSSWRRCIQEVPADHPRILGISRNESREACDSESPKMIGFLIDYWAAITIGIPIVNLRKLEDISDFLKF